MQSSEFRVEKQRADAILTLAGGASVSGHFFLAQASPTSAGRERVGELLNSESGFFPFENDQRQTVLYNRDHVVIVQLADNEAQLDPGYAVATTRTAVISLSNGRQLRGIVRVYRPKGRDRLSDWARHGQRFRYVEASEGTFLVNIRHVVDAHEVEP
jgi:hypothetical protein